MDSKENDVFEVIVSRLDDMIRENDLNKLKTIATEVYNFEDVQCIATFQHLLQELCEKSKLSRMELLQEVLLILNRKDLIKAAKEYRQMEFSGLYSMSEGIDCEQITARIEHLSYSKDHVQELVLKLSHLLFAPVNKIIVARIEEISSGGYICVFDTAGVYADILQDVLQSNIETTGLNYFGITDIYIRNTAYKIKGKMVPVELLHEHQKVISFLEEQNRDSMKHVDKMSESLDKLLPLISELGDPQVHMKKLENLHKYSGLSTTLWKILGKLSDDQLPEKYTPDLSQEEIRQQSLYSKARIQRIFPQLSMQKKIDCTKTS